MSERICSAEDCEKPHVARGYCRSHYRWIIKGQKPMVQSKSLMRDDPTDVRHGTENGYRNCACRCPRCKRAHADAIKAYLDSNPDRRRKWNERQLSRLERLRNG